MEQPTGLYYDLVYQKYDLDYIMELRLDSVKYFIDI